MENRRLLESGHPEGSRGHADHASEDGFLRAPRRQNAAIRPPVSEDFSSPRPAYSGVYPRLLKILICPQTRQPLIYDAAARDLVSAKARVAYPIRGGIPIMLPEEARDLEEQGPAI